MRYGPRAILKRRLDGSRSCSPPLIRAAPTLIDMPVNLSLVDFEELVAEALDSIPDDLAAHIENVAVQVQDWPNHSQTHAPTGACCSASTRV